jgi:hemerythrin HHE cation binding domain-containing protein
MGDVPDDDPFARVLAVHADFVDKLTELEATLDEMIATREASEGNGTILDESVRFFEEELLPFLGAEDEAILPRLEAAIGRFGTLVNVVAYEHDEIRRGVEKFKAARKVLWAHPSWAAIQETNRHGIFLVQFLWDHFRKERMSLYPTARERLSPSELQAIRERFAH